MENDVVPGGLADGLKLEEIATKHNVPIEELKLELDKGIAVEKEHTTDEKVATEIAMDHLVENPKYYEVLEKAETQTPAPETPTTPEQPQINIEEMIAKAVEMALAKSDERRNKELELAKAETKQKADLEIEKARKEAEQFKNENAELRRTQPTGLPDLKGQFGSVESTETEKAHAVAKGYRTGYRGY